MIEYRCRQTADAKCEFLVVLCIAHLTHSIQVADEFAHVINRFGSHFLKLYLAQ